MRKCSFTQISISFVLFLQLCCLCFARVPNDWADAINRGDMLYSDKEPTGTDYMPSISNGYVGTVVTTKDVFLSGVFSALRFPTDMVIHSERASIPASDSLLIKITNATTIGTALDMVNGCVLRRSTLDVSRQSPDVSELLIEQRWYSHRTLRSLLVHEITVAAQPKQLKAATPVEIYLSPNADQGSTFTSKHFRFKQIANETLCGGDDSDLCQAFEGALVKPERKANGVTVAVVTTRVPSSIQIKVDNRPQTFVFVTAVRSTLDTETPLSAAFVDFKYALQLEAVNPGSLYAQHQQGWESLWESGIEITPSQTSKSEFTEYSAHTMAKQINSTLYYLYSSMRDDWPWAPSPGGVPTNGYSGQVFWDSELWISLPMNLLHPELVRGSAIQYRADRIEAAEEMAAKNGYKGLMFPWQSGVTGLQIDLVHMINKHELHVVAGVGFAVYQHWASTHDLDWFLAPGKGGWEVLSGVADFWISYATFDSKTDSYHLHRIIGPDEYAMGFPLLNGVTDNVYTNAIVKIVLDFAVTAAMKLVPPELAPPAEKVAAWQRVSQLMTILFDEKKQLHPQYKNFPVGNTYFGGKVKQADVVLLGYPLNYKPLPLHVRYNDIMFYEPITVQHGPAMSHTMHAVAWLELRNGSKAIQQLEAGTQNIQPPFNVWTETPDPDHHPWDMGCFNFLTGAGGFAQAMLNGYVGIRIQLLNMTIDPQLPINGVAEIKVRAIHYNGQRFSLQYNDSLMSITLLAPPKPALQSTPRQLAVLLLPPLKMHQENDENEKRAADERLYPLIEGKTVTLPRSRAMILPID